MAATKALTFSTTKSALKQTNHLEDLVAPRERLDVPNHIVDTKIFSKLSQNSTTKVEPSVVNFAGYSLNKIQTRRIKICNSSSERQNFHIIPPSTKHFSIKYMKPRRFVPGFTIDVNITFVADEWRYYYDCIRIHCKGEENLVVPLHAYPVVTTSKFPRKLMFPNKSITLGESYTQLLPLSSEYPVEFEFKISLLQSHPSFTVQPLSGIIPGEGKTNIHVTFTPMEYITAHMTMQLSVSQFNTKPLICDVTASCQPPNANQLTKSVKDLDELYKQTKLFDPRCISPVQIARRRQKGAQITPISKTPTRHFERDGFQFLKRINTQHAVNSVLLQEKGKLKSKDLREAMQGKSTAASYEKSVQSLLSVESSHQVKEAAFEMIVRKDAVEERANQLRWQVRLGDEPMNSGSRTYVLRQREIAALNYKYAKRKDPDPEVEQGRVTTKRECQRSWRRANRALPVQPTFDLYKNNPWSSRHRALSRFQQAARIILIRCRAQKKVVMLRHMIEEFKRAQKTSTTSVDTAMPFEVEIHERGAATGKTKYQELISGFTPSAVKSFAFPVYASPDSKEDMAPDALGEVPVKPSEVEPPQHTPYHDLVVPKYYEIAGYQRWDVGEALKSYVAPGLPRALRTGAEDEIIKVTLPTHLISTDQSILEERIGDEMSEADHPSVEYEENQSSVVEEKGPVLVEEQSMATSSGLIPPPGLFKNPKFHQLQIFNRAPGVIRHYLPIPQSENDQDSFLCPMPKYTMVPGQTKFLDRKDVISGVMSWKKVSSHGLGALSQTPTLLDVWLPRWSDAFSQAMVPSKTPLYLDSLPKDDANNIAVEEGSAPHSFPLLTVDMVKDAFAGEEELKRDKESGPSEESIIEDSILSTTRMSSDQNTRISSKDQCQDVLEKVMLRKHDLLGSQIQERLTAMEKEFDKD